MEPVSPINSLSADWLTSHLLRATARPLRPFELFPASASAIAPQSLPTFSRHGIGALHRDTHQGRGRAGAVRHVTGCQPAL